jgi:hypothetical protein
LLQDTKAVFKELLLKWPGLNYFKPAVTSEDYCVKMAERVQTICAHMRRLHDSNKRWEEACGSMTEKEMKDLQAVMEIMEPQRAVSDRTSSATGELDFSSPPVTREVPECKESAGGSKCSTSSKKSKLDSLIERLVKQSASPENKKGSVASTPKRKRGDDSSPTKPAQARGSQSSTSPRRDLRQAFACESPGQQVALQAALLCSPVPPKKVDTKAQAAKAKERAKEEAKAAKAETAAAKSKATSKAKSKAKSQAKGKAKAKSKAKSKACTLNYCVVVMYMCVRSTCIPNNQQ